MTKEGFSKKFVTSVSNIPSIYYSQPEYQNYDVYISRGASIFCLNSNNEVMKGKKFIHATNMMVFDIDIKNGENPQVVYRLLNSYGAFDNLPCFSDVVCSGGGIHLYYALDRNMSINMRDFSAMKKDHVKRETLDSFLDGSFNNLKYRRTEIFYNSIANTFWSILKKGIESAVNEYRSTIKRDFPELEGSCLKILNGVRLDPAVKHFGGDIRLIGSINQKTKTSVSLIESYTYEEANAINEQRFGYCTLEDMGRSVCQYTLWKFADLIIRNKLYDLCDEKETTFGKRGVFDVHKRDEEIKKYIEYMGEDIVGFRNTTLRIYAFNLVNMGISYDGVCNMVKHMNGLFEVPQPESEVHEYAIATSAFECFNKWSGVKDETIRMYLGLSLEEAQKLGIFCSQKMERENKSKTMSMIVSLANIILEDAYGVVSQNKMEHSISYARKKDKSLSMKRQRVNYTLDEIEKYFSNENIATFIKGFNTYENKEGKMIFELPKNKDCDGSFIKIAVLRIVRKYKSLVLLEKENRDRYYAKKEMDTYREVVVKANSREGLAGISSYKLEKAKSTFQFPIILLMKKFSMHPKVFKNT